MYSPVSLGHLVNLGAAVIWAMGAPHVHQWWRKAVGRCRARLRAGSCMAWQAARTLLGHMLAFGVVGLTNEASSSRTLPLQVWHYLYIVWCQSADQREYTLYPLVLVEDSINVAVIRLRYSA